MASRAAAKLPNNQKTPAANALDNYDVDDFDDDPFAESGGENDQAKASGSKKRKEGSGLGLDEEVAVTKRARVPNVKLDETRLLSDKGIPKLRRKAKDLRFKGKGHEFGDMARLLSFYQLWLDDLFPKAQFLDGLTMIEKAGHKKTMQLMRLEWINEEKPKHAATEDSDPFADNGQGPEERDAAIFPERLAPIFQNKDQGSGRPKTPTAEGDDLFGDDDIYGATPKRVDTRTDKPTTSNDDAPDEDDLDALLAETESRPSAPKSLFGNGSIASRPARVQDEPDEDDLDALMAEAEAESRPSVLKTTSGKTARPNPTPAPAVDDQDDLDALMAEAEAQESLLKGQEVVTKASQKVQAEAEKGVDADEEEAMAEMEGLW